MCRYCRGNELALNDIDIIYNQFSTLWCRIVLDLDKDGISIVLNLTKVVFSFQLFAAALDNNDIFLTYQLANSETSTVRYFQKNVSLALVLTNGMLKKWRNYFIKKKSITDNDKRAQLEIRLSIQRLNLCWI